MISAEQRSHRAHVVSMVPRGDMEATRGLQGDEPHQAPSPPALRYVEPVSKSGQGSRVRW